MISVENLTKTFKISKRDPGLKNAVKSFFSRDYTTVNALLDISFTINEGEIVGYIGPNGAGKSTTIKIMSGILVPDSGICNILGRTPWHERIAHVKNIGVVFGQRSQLWWDVPVCDSFELLRDIYKVDSKEYKKNYNLLVETLNLSDIIKTPTRQLSLGQRMRCEIAASLIHSPNILFLDEPTIGLDAVSKIAMRNFIKTVNKEKKITVILTTHDMSDIDALTNRVMLIGKGNLLYDGSLNLLTQKYITHKNLIIDYEKNPSQININGVQVISQTDESAELKVDIGVISITEVISLINTLYKVHDITVESQSIEETIARIYKEYKI